MARLRKKVVEANQSESNQSSSSKHEIDKKSASFCNLSVCLKFSVICILICVIAYFGFIGYLETRVNTPFNGEKIIASARFMDNSNWGTYRPGTYFGLKAKNKYSPVMGMMWYFPRTLQTGEQNIRHWCENGDNLDKYGWNKHDGRNFGIQEILDGPVRIETSFIKSEQDNDWTARISISNRSRTNELVSIIWYTALEEKNGGWIRTNIGENEIPVTIGEVTDIGKFSVTIHNIEGRILDASFLSTNAVSLQVLRETVRNNFRLRIDKTSKSKWITLPGEMLNEKKEMPNFIATQLTFRANVPFTIDIAYKHLKDDFAMFESTIGDEMTTLLEEKSRQFSEKFEKTFHLQTKGFSPADIQFAEATMSNLVGGIGYFYGASRVQSTHTKEPVPYWKAPLFTAVPSRSFFPRGFLWDEAFHGLLIASWDVDLELEIMSYWFDLMNVEGWIPREQILGVEAIAKVPEQFITQKNTNANPPVFFLTMQKILHKYPADLHKNDRIEILEAMYPRLQAWFNWFNSTQKSEQLGTYRWRGRDQNSVEELNPKTLTSGLDDYPRASHPTDNEKHVDLRCWIALAAKVMADLSQILSKPNEKYTETYNFLADNDILNEQHLSPITGTYSDWGYHSDAVVLQRPKRPNLDAEIHRMHHEQHLPKIRVVKEFPEFRFVDSAFGYVSLFPFLSEILSNDSPALNETFMKIRDTNYLWTNYGLRSLSKTSPLYDKRNTEHDPPYWRGPIWININYLTLKALRHYSNQPGPYMEEAKKIYLDLRHNIISNMILRYKQTGYVWEQYDDKTGEGKGCKGFTGWSALVILIMAEEY